MPEEEAENVPPEFECSICMKLLLDPVSVTCGHTFCRSCLEQSLGYRGLCAVCRAPVAGVQAVNVLIKSIIADRFPRALQERQREKQEELSAAEHQANEDRREASRAVGTNNIPVLPLTRSFPLVLPHCRTEVEITYDSDIRLIEHALQGSRRLGAIDGIGGYDDECRPFGVCLEIENVERNQGQMRVRLVGKHRFCVVEAPQQHEAGFELGRCEAFFDEPLPLAALLLTSQVAESEGTNESTIDEPTVPEIAKAVLDLLERQLEGVGNSGRHVFTSAFGDIQQQHQRIRGSTGASTSAAMEQVSFWILGTLVCKDEFRQNWLASTDTRSRLQACGHLLETAGSRTMLNLPGARSWMSPGQSALSSLLLLLAIVVVLIAKAMGLFEQRRRSHYAPRTTLPEETVEDAWIFAQMLR